MFFLGFAILLSFFINLYFLFLFNSNFENAIKFREGSDTLKCISINSMKIYAGLDVSNGISEVKEKRDKFEIFLKGEKRNLKGIKYEEFYSIWKESIQALNILIKNERGSSEFLRAYNDLESYLSPLIEKLESVEKQFRRDAKFNILIFGAINLIIIISLPLFFTLLQRKAFSDLKEKRVNIKRVLENLNKEVDELADEIEEISTKTIKLSLQKSEGSYSTFTSSLEKMRKMIDSFLSKSLVTEENYESSVQKLIDSLSLSLNSIIANTIVEMEKFKEMEKSLEKINSKLSYLKKRVAEISHSIKSKEKEI